MKEEKSSCNSKLLKELKESGISLTFEQPKPKGLLQSGWICPRCGAGCSPYTNQCPCINTTYTFT